MLTSLGLIFLLGLLFAAAASFLKLPRVTGMLLCGVLIGPFALNLLDPSILGVSGDLRQLALIIILIKAGLSLSLDDLKKVGRPALLMSFLPAVCEIIGCVLLAPVLLGISVQEAALLGSVLGAVSPAVVVPRMVKMMDEGLGTEKRIPQLILAGASLDDVFVIVLFSVFVSLVQGGQVGIGAFLDVPVSVVTGIAVGFAAGLLLQLFFRSREKLGKALDRNVQMIVLLGVALLLKALEELVKPWFALSGLLAVMGMAITMAAKLPAAETSSLKSKTGSLWMGAELLLFLLVGAAVDIRYTLNAGLPALVLILLCLVFRSVGTMLCVLGTPLNRKERFFCVLAYLPKATVQAAIGGVPLALGLGCGTLVLSVAVLSILVTAPLGAFLMDWGAPRLCVRSGEDTAR